MKQLTKYFALGSILLIYSFFAWGISATIIDQIWKLEDIESIDGSCWQSRSFPSWYFTTSDSIIVFRGYEEMPSCFSVSGESYINEHIELSKAYIISTLTTLIIISTITGLLIYYISRMKTRSKLEAEQK